MTIIEQKQAVYKMLKKCAYYLSGETSVDFQEEAPEFTDFKFIPAALPTLHNASTSSIETIEDIAAQVRECTKCPLCKTRKNAVPGIGAQKPLVLVVGEAPGEQEDLRGEPFVGPAGQLLDKMLGSISLSREKNCFIANTIKCRPPWNRDPSPEEENACSHFLEMQLKVLQPAAILAVGRIAAQKMLNTSDGINRLRGIFFDYNGIPFMATFHPSALLRDASLKKGAWGDLQIFRNRLREIAFDYEKRFVEN